jgi:uncharacterized membrane protein
MAWDKNLFSKVMIGFGFVMVAIFFGIGIALIFFPVYNYLPPNLKTVLGVFFMAYGFFRLARIYQNIREQKRKDYYNE